MPPETIDTVYFPAAGPLRPRPAGTTTRIVWAPAGRPVNRKTPSSLVSAVASDASSRPLPLASTNTLTAGIPPSDGSRRPLALPSAQTAPEMLLVRATVRLGPGVAAPSVTAALRSGPVATNPVVGRRRIGWLPADRGASRYSPEALVVAARSAVENTSDHESSVPTSPHTSSVTCSFQVPLGLAPSTAESDPSGLYRPVNGATPDAIEVAASSSKTVAL